MTMTILEWGAVGELIGGGAVIATLIYLAFQLRQNTKSVNAANYYGAVRMYNEINAVAAADESVASIALRGFNEPDSLNAVEAAQFGVLCRGIISSFTSVRWMYEDGSFPLDRYRVFEHNFAHMAVTPGGWKVIQEQAASPEIVELAGKLRESMEPLRMSRFSGFGAPEEGG